MGEEELIGLREASELTRVSKTTIGKWIKNGEVQALKDESGRVLVSRSALLDFAEKWPAIRDARIRLNPTPWRTPDTRPRVEDDWLARAVERARAARKEVETPPPSRCQSCGCGGGLIGGVCFSCLVARNGRKVDEREIDEKMSYPVD